MWKNHRKMDKYTIMKRNLYSISYFPFLLAAGVALAGRGTSFGLAGDARASVELLALRSGGRDELVILPIALAGRSGLSSLLFVRDMAPFLLNMSDSRPRRSRLLPAALMSESDP